MKHLSRRSVTTGLAAAVTAIPAVALCIAARGDPFDTVTLREQPSIDRAAVAR